MHAAVSQDVTAVTRPACFPVVYDSAAGDYMVRCARRSNFHKMRTAASRMRSPRKGTDSRMATRSLVAGTGLFRRS